MSRCISLTWNETAILMLKRVVDWQIRKWLVADWDLVNFCFAPSPTPHFIEPLEKSVGSQNIYEEEDQEKIIRSAGGGRDYFLDYNCTLCKKGLNIMAHLQWSSFSTPPNTQK